jgi:hypothetical protein
VSTLDPDAPFLNGESLTADDAKSDEKLMLRVFQMLRMGWVDQVGDSSNKY